MSELIKIKLAGLVSDSIVDGVGLRLAIFFQGCPHNCLGCHNPETHDFDLAGKYYFAQEIFDLAINNKLLDGITFTGGEPFFQSDALFYLAKGFKEINNNYNLAIYTGYLFEELISNPKYSSVLNYCDVLIDGKFILEQRDLNLRFRGSRNQRIIDLKKSLAQNKIILADNWY